MPARVRNRSDRIRVDARLTDHPELMDLVADMREEGHSNASILVEALKALHRERELG